MEQKENLFLWIHHLDCNCCGILQLPRNLCKKTRAVKILTTRSSAGIGSFSLFLHLSFTCLSPINDTRHSTPVMMAPPFTEVIFLNIKMTIWKQYATHFNWLLSAGLVFNLVLHHKTLRDWLTKLAPFCHPILNQSRIALIFSPRISPAT